MRLLSEIDLGWVAQVLAAALIVLVIVSALHRAWMWWWGSMMAIFRPQVVVQRTSRSPFQIFLSCALRTLLIVIALGVVVAWMIFQRTSG